ncbi:hypothetical protein [Leucobacter denitrificans]|nr:hypothetical protein [Leucobacter denitrificans]
MSAVDELSETQEQSSSIAELAPTRPTADRFMRALLRVNGIKKTRKAEQSAHRNMQIAMIITGIRCIITYLAIPIAVPIIGLSGAVSAPIGIGLSIIAVVTGISSLRQFWRSDHKYRWMYTAFIAVIFIVLAIALVSDISTIVRGA